MIGGENLTKFASKWQQLQIDKDFCDVTLACDEGQIESHKIILSHSSLILRNILKETPNPIIYFRGVKYEHLKNLVSFMYQGQVTIAKEYLKEILAVAEDLKIKGLSKGNIETFIPTEKLPQIIDKVLLPDHNEDFHKTTKITKLVQTKYIESSSKKKQEIQKTTEMITADPNLTPISASQYFEVNTSQNLETAGYNKFSELIEKKHNKENLVSVSNKPFICNMCDKQYIDTGSLITHKVLAHKGVRYPCDQCDASPFLNLSNLSRHKASVHKGVRYPCDQCDASPFLNPSNLKRHKASVHEGVRYPCDQCDVAPFIQAGNLRQHKASEHEGVRYPCDQCNVKSFSTFTYLRRHKASAHEGVRYPCDQCNSTPYIHQSHLRQHKASAHEGIRYPCDHCNAGPFTTRTHLKQHKASVHEGVRYPCDQCNDVLFMSKSNLRLHKASVHKGVRYPCDRCNAAPFTSLSHMKRHKASAHEGVHYECESCNYKSTTKSNLKKHTKRIHNI